MGAPGRACVYVCGASDRRTERDVFCRSPRRQGRTDLKQPKRRPHPPPLGWAERSVGVASLEFRRTDGAPHTARRARATRAGRSGSGINEAVLGGARHPMCTAVHAPRLLARTAPLAPHRAALCTSWPLAGGGPLCRGPRARTNALLERRALELLTHARLHVRVLVAAPRASTRQMSCAVRRTHVALWPRTPHCSAALADHQCGGCGG